MLATLLRNVPSGLTRDENEQLVSAGPYVGKTGTVIERQDTGYDAEYPTGYEPILYLVDFGDKKLWIPGEVYLGEQRNGKDVWVKYLSLAQENTCPLCGGAVKRSQLPRYPRELVHVNVGVMYNHAVPMEMP